MRGREVFMQNLVAHGVRHIFGNPGTTENPLLDSLIDCPCIDYVVHLHEGIAVGAAGYYARAARRAEGARQSGRSDAPGEGVGASAHFHAARNRRGAQRHTGQCLARRRGDTAKADFEAAFQIDAPDQYLGARGGSIGQGLAGAIGASIAHPGRPVVCVSGDGSAMYSIPALWTAAHHDLPIVFVILANREYRVLKQNLDVYRERFDALSSKPYPEMDLNKPAFGFVEMAAGAGMMGVRVSRPEELAGAIEQAFAAKAPRLVEIAIESMR